MDSELERSSWSCWNQFSASWQAHLVPTTAPIAPCRSLDLHPTRLVAHASTRQQVLLKICLSATYAVAHFVTSLLDWSADHARMLVRLSGYACLTKGLLPMDRHCTQSCRCIHISTPEPSQRSWDVQNRDASCRCICRACKQCYRCASLNLFNVSNLFRHNWQSFPLTVTGPSGANIGSNKSVAKHGSSVRRITTVWELERGRRIPETY